MKIILLILAINFSFNTFSFEGIYEVIIKKQVQKESTRWTLSDWLFTKKKIALQDQWLAMHSSDTWFEFMGESTVSSEVDQYQSNTGLTETKDFERLTGAIYLRSLGFEYQKQKVGDETNSTDYIFNLIIWGSSLQSTHVRGLYGKRDYEWENYSKYSQNFYGFAGSVYLAKFLGTDILWRKYSDTKGDNNVYEMRGERVELGAFIDVFFIRLRASLYKEKLFFEGINASTNQLIRNDEGTILSAQLFL